MVSGLRLGVVQGLVQNQIWNSWYQGGTDRQYEMIPESEPQMTLSTK